MKAIIRASLIAATLSANLIAAGCAARVVVPVPPPARVEVIGRSPYAGAVWVPGHWQYSRRRADWVWIGGRWR